MVAITECSDNQKISVEYFGNAIIEEFIASRHGSETTQRTYRNACRVLLNYFAANLITNPTTADVDAFINQLRKDGKSKYTIKLYNTVMKMFFAYLEKNNKYPDVASQCERLKLTKDQTHSKDALESEQAKKLLNSIKENEIEDKLVTRRDKAIIALCLQAGLRTVEVARADVKDLQESSGFWLLDVQGKGRLKKDAKVKVALPVARLILSYLELRDGYDKLKNTDAPLFASTSNNNSKFGNRYSEQAIGKMIKARMKACGINSTRITAHSTRHFAATTAIEAGVDLREVSEMLRHSSILTTTTYLHDLSVKKRRAELAVANVLFND